MEAACLKLLRPEELLQDIAWNDLQDDKSSSLWQLTKVYVASLISVLDTVM